MPIHSARSVDTHIARLEKTLLQLKGVLKTTPLSDDHTPFTLSKEDFLRDFRSIDPDDLEEAISAVSAALKIVKNLKKSDASLRLHRP